MPITPFHFGLGAALGAIAPRQVSFLAFCAVNVAIDLESLVHLVAGIHPVHTFFHTYLGASLAGAATFTAFWALARWPPAQRAAMAGRSTALEPMAVAIGCATGAWSHVLLDSVMHSDMRPLAPWSDANALLGAVSLSTLHLACLGALVLGGVVLLARVLVRHRRDS